MVAADTVEWSSLSEPELVDSMIAVASDGCLVASEVETVRVESVSAAEDSSTPDGIEGSVTSSVTSELKVSEDNE